MLASQRFGGNCFGLTFGRFINYAPKSALINEEARLRYIKAKGGDDAEARAATTAALRGMAQDRELMGEVARLSIQAIAAVDATVTEDDSRARYAWFDEHITVKLGAPLNQWISRNTNAAPIYVHSTLEQLAGSELGKIITRYEAEPALAHRGRIDLTGARRRSAHGGHGLRYTCFELMSAGRAAPPAPPTPSCALTMASAPE